MPELWNNIRICFNKCEFCGYILTPIEENYTSASNDENNISSSKEESNMLTPDKDSSQKTNTESVRWVGPRIIMHIFCIIAGCLSISQWDTMNKLVELSKMFGSVSSRYETMLTWCLIFGIIMIILGVIGLVKIHSSASCLLLAILHIIAILPFADLNELLIPQSNILLAFMVSLATMALCGAAIMKKEGVASGWLMLICLIAIIVYITMNYESENEINNFLSQDLISSVNVMQNLK